MATLINPKCAQEIFLMENEELAGTCGLLNGIIGAVVFTIIICSIVAFIIFSKSEVNTVTSGTTVNTVNEVDEYGRPKRKPINKILILGGACCCVIMIWIFALFFSSWLKKNEWKQGQMQIESYMAQGMSRPKAISKLQDLHQAKMQAEATRQMGRNLSTGYPYNTGYSTRPTIGISF